MTSSCYSLSRRHVGFVPRSTTYSNLCHVSIAAIDRKWDPKEQVHSGKRVGQYTRDHVHRSGIEDTIGSIEVKKGFRTRRRLRSTVLLVSPGCFELFRPVCSRQVILTRRSVRKKGVPSQATTTMIFSLQHDEIFAIASLAHEIDKGCKYASLLCIVQVHSFCLHYLWLC